MKRTLPKMLQDSVLPMIVALALAPAFPGHAAEPARKNLPISPETAPERPAKRAPQIDPQTGLPMPRQTIWIDPTWTAPDKTLASVDLDGVPLSEVAKFLRVEFKDAFDVLIPSGWKDTQESSRPVDTGSFTVKLQLKNVTATEIFNAMNIVLEGENTPARWELRMNGARPTAVLRYLPDLLPTNPAFVPADPPKRMVYFVGNLLGDEKSGGFTMEQLVKTVTEVYEMSYGKPPQGTSGSPQKTRPRLPRPMGRLQFHHEAQLLIFTGTSDEVNFIQSTLSALRGKMEQDRRRKEEVPPAKP